jgi:hypothetical protein
MQPLTINRLTKAPTTWPKPSATPTATLGFTAALIVSAALMLSLGLPITGLLIGAAPLLAFVMHAERTIYQHEKRNYDGWHAEMAALMAPRQPSQDRWARSLSQVQRQRRR